MRKLIAFLLLVPAAAFAQLDRPWDEVDDDPMERYFDYGSNWSIDARNNVTLGMHNYAHYIDYSWHGMDDDDEEEIEEIIVTAKRRVNRGWDLWAQLQLNLVGQRFCTNYTDGGHCNATELVYDPELIPIAGRCQTIQGSLGPLTGAQANQLNTAWVNEQASGAAMVTVGTFLLTRGRGRSASNVRAYIAAIAAGATTINSFIGELPFTAGDNVTWTLRVCNDGEGGVDSTMDVDVN